MIGRTLINKIKDKYQDYLRIAVIAYDNEMHFFDRFANIVVNYASITFPMGFGVPDHLSPA